MNSKVYHTTKRTDILTYEDKFGQPTAAFNAETESSSALQPAKDLRSDSGLQPSLSDEIRWQFADL